ncbi:hypothetical protein MNV49_003819 [Pseudohyphozyma bogoriensis]|nr:hypothetical protein MNV49_003819 [Pseudohyphozyma bogoriensis]
MRSALYTLLLLASLASAKVVPLPGQSALEAADATLFERYVASHLRAYHRHVTPAATGENAGHLSHLSSLLKTSKVYHRTHDRSRARQGKVAFRAGILKGNKGATAADQHDTEIPLLAPEDSANTVAVAEGEADADNAKRGVDTFFKGEVDEVETEEDWSWMEGGDEGDDEESDGEENAGVFEEYAAKDTPANRMEVRMKKLGSHL